MLSILPAFSSPDLKVFLLLKKSFKSSAGGQGETVSEASASFRSSLRPSSTQLDLRSRSVPAVASFLPTGVCHFSHRLAKERFCVGAWVVLSIGLCQSRKDRYLPPERLCVRLLPRTNVLAPYGICRQFPHPLSRTRKPPSNTIGQSGLTDASASVLTSPSYPARRS